MSTKKSAPLKQQWPKMALGAKSNTQWVGEKTSAMDTLLLQEQEGKTLQPWYAEGALTALKPRGQYHQCLGLFLGISDRFC